MITFGEYFKRRAEGETVTAIAKTLGVSNKAIQRRLKEAGYEAEGSQWIWQGEGEEPLEKEMVFGKSGQPIRKQGTSKRTKERKNEPTKEQTNTTTKEPRNEPTNTITRKRSSFDIDIELMRELKVKSALENKKIYEMVEQAIREYLRKDQ